MGNVLAIWETGESDSDHRELREHRAGTEEEGFQGVEFCQRAMSIGQAISKARNRHTIEIELNFQVRLTIHLFCQKDGQALMVKLIWDLTPNSESLWVKWVHEYYVKSETVWSYTLPVSASWQMRKIWKLRHDALRCIVPGVRPTWVVAGVFLRLYISADSTAPIADMGRVMMRVDYISEYIQTLFHRYVPLNYIDPALTL
ncbi:RNA-directed DNA polymerase (reversetranscriptase)-related family protein [Striga asiatica]|uniref:RNA-directed DNA polymerase (Reversetranscriptase)-related family protein n=1 Tax=Striga asiatica TaxID=4170 RepID=A0A5A7Q267_STRAF|nr:RNA-directed DNA polymerase (reversetranscriptase)-related family protein [Striga asiatica]